MIVAIIYIVKFTIFKIILTILKVIFTIFKITFTIIKAIIPYKDNEPVEPRRNILMRTLE